MLLEYSVIFFYVIITHSATRMLFSPGREGHPSLGSRTPRDAPLTPTEGLSGSAPTAQHAAGPEVWATPGRWRAHTGDSLAAQPLGRPTADIGGPLGCSLLFAEQCVHTRVPSTEGSSLS
jgi:hypothetical protein